MKKNIITRKGSESWCSIVVCRIKKWSKWSTDKISWKGYGTTWLGADGATLTLEKGIIIASRGMGTDVMGGYTNIPVWNEILIEENYTKVSVT